MEKRNNYYQKSNSNLQFDLENKKTGIDLKDDITDVIRLINNSFARIFKEAYNNTTGGKK